MRGTAAAIFAIALISRSDCLVSLEGLAALAAGGNSYDCTEDDLTEVPHIIHQASHELT